MRRPTLRTRDLLIIILFLGWNRRRERLAGIASRCRDGQSTCDLTIADTPRWWNTSIARGEHAEARNGQIDLSDRVIDHPRPSMYCPDCVEETGRAYGRAAEAYEAASWFPWKSIPADLIESPEPWSRPLTVLPLPEG
jgi:hypothetical protein